MGDAYIISHFPESIRSHHMISKQPVTNNYHLHDSYEIYLFLGGNADFYVEHNCYHLKRGNLMIINNKEVHRYLVHDHTPYERISTHFNPILVRNACTKQSDLLSCFENRPNGRDNITILDEDALEKYLSLADKLHTAMKADCYGSDILASTYLLQLLVMVNTCFNNSTYLPHNTIPELSYQVMQFIDQNLKEHFTLEELANQFYLDRSYLSRKFKEQAGCTLQEYLILKRVSLAKTFLSEGKTVSEACELSGFHDYSNFIRTFTKYAKISPGKYRSKNLGLL